MLGLGAHTARGLQIKGLLVRGFTCPPPGHILLDAFLSFLPWAGCLLCFPLMSHPWLHCVPRLGASWRTGPVPSGLDYTASTWATLSKSWKNWIDVPIAPNQSQPQACLILLLSLVLSCLIPPATGESCDSLSALQAVVWTIYFLL